MNDNIGNILNSQLFFKVSDFLGKQDNNLQINIKCVNKAYKVYEESRELSFKAGVLLMLFYVFNIKLRRDSIEYFNDIFYIRGNESAISNKENLTEVTVENIINDLIERSITNKEFFPSAAGELNEASLLEVKAGFVSAYECFINHKIDLFKLIEVEYKEYAYVIRNIKTLNYNDLWMQLRIMDFKFRLVQHNHIEIDKISTLDYNEKDDLTHIVKFIDTLIQSGVIGFGQYGLELMWSCFLQGTFQPMGYRNVYVALVVAYEGKHLENNYYIQQVKSIINPVLTILKSNKDLKINEAQYIELLELILLLERYIEYPELQDFIADNNDIFSKSLHVIIDKEDCLIEKIFINAIKKNLLPIIDKIMVKWDLI